MSVGPTKLLDFRQEPSHWYFPPQNGVFCVEISSWSFYFPLFPRNPLLFCLSIFREISPRNRYALSKKSAPGGSQIRVFLSNFRSKEPRNRCAFRPKIRSRRLRGWKSIGQKTDQQFVETVAAAHKRKNPNCTRTLMVIRINHDANLRALRNDFTNLEIADINGDSDQSWCKFECSEMISRSCLPSFFQTIIQDFVGNM